MAEPFLLISVVIISVIILVIMSFLVVYFGHPDDRNEAKFPKLVVVFGLWLAFASVLIMPYDVAASKSSDGGGIRVDILWQIAYITMAVMVVVVIPFAFFYYEAADDDENSSQVAAAVKGTVLFLVIFVVVLVIFFSFLSTAEIPVTRVAVPGDDSGYVILSSTPFSTNLPSSKKPQCETADGKKWCLITNFIWDIPVTFPIYIVAFISFLGWFFFTIFVGVGLVALPLDFLNEYKSKPQRMDVATYISTKKELGRRAASLLDVGVALQNESRNNANPSRAEKRRQAAALRSFEQNYYLLKRDIEVLKISYELKGGNPVWYFLKLVIAIVGGILSITWFIHILIFILPPVPVHPFLNDVFIGLETDNFPFFGIIAFALWSTYLLWCCVKGNFKLGMRLLFIKVYPMEIGKTLMNAFLANTWIIIICAIPTVQFCVTAFPIYSRQTQADLLFGSQIRYMQFFRYFFANEVFVFVIVILNGLTAIYLAARPKDVAAQIEAKINKVASKNPNGDDDD